MSSNYKIKNVPNKNRNKNHINVKSNYGSGFFFFKPKREEFQIYLLQKNRNGTPP